MNSFYRYLREKNEAGFSYIEVLIALSIFAISITPIFSMIFSASKNAISGKRYYEATIMAQNLSEEIKREIEKNLANNSFGGFGSIESLALFLYPTDTDYLNTFNTAFNGDEYDYDVYIKETDGTTTEYKLMETNKYTFVHIDGGSNLLSQSPNTIIELDPTDSETAIFGSYSGGTPPADSIDFGYDGLNWSSSNSSSNVTLTWEDSPPSYDIVVTDASPPADSLETTDRIDINLDASKLEDESFKLDIKLENKTKANVIFTIFRKNEVNDLDKNIEVFPVQTEAEGNIFIERKTKVSQQNNYIIRIIVRDRKDSSKKILKDMVDIYAYDYRTITY